jgi:hypothetical protein
MNNERLKKNTRLTVRLSLEEERLLNLLQRKTGMDASKIVRYGLAQLAIVYKIDPKQYKLK